MLDEYLKHQKDVVTRRTKFELNKAEERAHIIKGLLIALDNIDEVIKIIRGSRTTADAKKNLIERFGLSDAQSQAIVETSSVNRFGKRRPWSRIRWLNGKDWLLKIYSCRWKQTSYSNKRRNWSY